MDESAVVPGSDAGSSAPGPRGNFPDTAWSAISMAGRGEGGMVLPALRKLTLDYWKPLYLYLRKRGEGHEDASDSVQGFFEFVFSSGFFSHVDREGGRFRSYLLKSLERWRSRRQVRDGAQKRGGHVVHVALDELDAMEQSAALAGDETPELVYDRQWAADLVALAVGKLRGDYEARERGAWFEALKAALPGGGELSGYARLAEELGTSEGAVKKAVFDLRAAFANHLKSQIRATVRSNEEAEEELRYLVQVMGGR